MCVNKYAILRQPPTEAANVLRAFFHCSGFGLWLRSHLKRTRSLNDPVTPSVV